MRAIVVVLAVLASVLVVADSMHLALVAHAVCPEHGELVHVDEAAGPRQLTRSDQPVASGDHDGDHSHDHCSALGHDELATPQLDLAVPQRLGDGVRVERPVAWLQVRSRKELLLLAPKTSPPA